MRRFSLDWLWVVVALALQAAAATGFDRYEGASTLGRDDAVCLERGAASADRRAPAGDERHAANCISCQTCLAGNSPLLSYASAGRLVGRFDSSSIVWPVLHNGKTRSRLARSHRARAPPSLG